MYKTSLAKMPGLQVERRSFAELLGNLMHRSDTHIIYVDESAFNTEMVLKKSWCLPDKPNLTPIDNRSAVTVFGAISATALTHPVFHLGRSTNKLDFMAFLRKVKAAVKHGVSKPVLIYDGASAHTAKDSQTMLNALFQPLKMPAHSSQFNCKFVDY